MAAIAYNNLSDSTATTIVASSSAALMPVARLKDPHIERKWRGAAGTTEYLTIDLGSAQSFDTVVLMGLNLTLAGTTRVRVSATDPTATASLLYDSASAAGRVDPAYGYLIVLLTSPVTGRYIRVDLSDASLSYIEAGRLATLLRTRLTYNFAPGWSWTYTDLSRKTVSRGGQTYIDRNVSYRTIEMTFENLTLSERNGIVEQIDRVSGEHADILFLSNEASDNLGRDSVWGLIEGNRPITQPYVTDVYSKSYRIRERAVRLLFS